MVREQHFIREFLCLTSAYCCSENLRALLEESSQVQRHRTDEKSQWDNMEYECRITQVLWIVISYYFQMTWYSSISKDRLRRMKSKTMKIKWIQTNRNQAVPSLGEAAGRGDNKLLPSLAPFLLYNKGFSRGQWDDLAIRSTCCSSRVLDLIPALTWHLSTVFNSSSKGFDDLPGFL